MFRTATPTCASASPGSGREGHHSVADLRFLSLDGTVAKAAVRPELVEGHQLLFKKLRGFDRLSPNGFGFAVIPEEESE